MDIAVDQGACTRCGACVALCIGRVFGRVDGRIEVVAAEACWLCGHCVAACPADAIGHSEYPIVACPALDPATLPSLDGLVGALRERRSSRVFRDRQDKPIPPRTFERGIRRLIRLARIPDATIHSFRHTFASHLAMAGVPLPTIQQLLGHRDIQTVMIYAHLSPSHVQQSVTALPF